MPNHLTCLLDTVKDHAPDVTKVRGGVAASPPGFSNGSVTIVVNCTSPNPTRSKLRAVRRYRSVLVDLAPEAFEDGEYGLTVVGRTGERVQKLHWTGEVWANEMGETVPAPDYWALPEVL